MRSQTSQAEIGVPERRPNHPTKGGQTPNNGAVGTNGTSLCGSAKRRDDERPEPSHEHDPRPPAVERSDQTVRARLKDRRRTIPATVRTVRNRYPYSRQAARSDGLQRRSIYSS